MITAAHIIQMKINTAEMNLVKQMSMAACRGGVSRVRTGESRMGALFEDQLVGQVGTYAGHKFWFGHSYNYLVSRQMANIYPGSGDGGSDVVGANIDFKTSKIRSNRPLLDYRLVVRPHERTSGKIYVQLLAEITGATATVHILGWASDDMLTTLAQDGVFAGAYVLPAQELQALPPLRWSWIETAQQAQSTGVLK